MTPFKDGDRVDRLLKHLLVCKRSTQAGPTLDLSNVLEKVSNTVVSRWAPEEARDHVIGEKS